MNAPNAQIQNQTGDASLLQSPKLTAFLCSHRVPVGTTEDVIEWIDSLTPDTVVMCGNLTGIEQMALTRLQQRGIPTVLVLATALTPTNAKAQLTITPIGDPTVTSPTGASSALRNQLMISLARQIVVGFMSENGNLARQLLGHPHLLLLHPDGQSQVAETNAQRLQSNAERMGWAIYDQLHTGTLSSIDMRRLLQQYLQLDLQRPSTLHSLILFTVVRHYSKLPDFNFTAFFKLWEPDTFRLEDLKAKKVNGKWMPSLSDRVIARLFKAMPSKFHAPINPAEQFDPQLAHELLDAALLRSPNNKRMLQRALNLAFYERNSQAIAKYQQLLGKESKAKQ